MKDFHGVIDFFQLPALMESGVFMTYMAFVELQADEGAPLYNYFAKDGQSNLISQYWDTDLCDKKFCHATWLGSPTRMSMGDSTQHVWIFI